MSSLPAPLTRFVGREAELAETAALLADTRLLTLIGSGGAGKTRLALRVVSAVADDFPDGVWFVDFSPLSDGEFVWDRVAMTMGVKEPGPGKTLADAVGRYLAHRQALLVLDNCEHVVETAAEVVATVLASAPRVKLVTTSREPLSVAGEVTWAVPPLTESDGVELFRDRARHALPQFRLRQDEREAVLDICRRLDGLPLAIELAAARTRILDPSQIAAGLRDRLALLPKGPRTAPPRQATLGASFDWSFQLLSGPEQALLRQLSVFAGGFDAKAALAVCPAASLQLLAALTDRSLIVVERLVRHEEPRFRMLETVRQFAAEHLDEAQEVDLIRTRHRDYYTQLAEIAEPGLTSPDDARWQALLLTEQENLRSALAWSRDQNQPEELARLVAALGWFWGLANRLSELQRWQVAVRERAEEISPRLRARLGTWECLVAVFSGRLQEVPALLNDTLALARAAGSKRDEASALAMLGVVAGLIYGAEAMRPYVEEAVPMARSAGYAYAEVMALEFFVMLRLFQSRPEDNWRLIQEAIAVAKASVARHTQLTVRSVSGVIAITQGRLSDAREILASVVADGREMTDFNYLHSLIDVALVEMFRGDFATARSLVAESLAAAESSEAEGRSAAGVGLHSRLVLGWIQLADGDAVQARESMAAVAEALRSSIGRAMVALPLVLLADAHLAMGALDESAATLDEATSMADTRKLTWLVGRARLVRAKLRAREGNLQEAESLAHEALTLGREAGDQMGLVDGLELLGALAAEQDSNKEAIRLWAAADSLRSELGYARFPADRGPHDAAVAAARESVGADDFAAAWSEGAKLSPDDAVAYAARGRGERKRPATGWPSLTPSELEVVHLVGEHLTNPEIAGRLFVSRATVKTHLVHIFNKLGIKSRSELVAEAIKRGIQAQSRGRS
jgi:predicted ATPase/DNA-binding CsgD family transcriptional regulator